ncbi:MAG: hypothetical protein ACR2P0_05055 [Acidimicrobiales bacterium]
MTRWLLTSAVLELGALFWILVGPKHDVVCDDASFPDTIVGDMFGHVDTATATLCTVPTASAWWIAAALLLAALAAIAVAVRLSPRFESLK